MFKSEPIVSDINKIILVNNEHITLDYNKLNSLMNMKYEELLLFLIFGSARWLSWCFDLRHGLFGFDKTYILQL
jgi:hypothetical protein